MELSLSVSVVPLAGLEDFPGLLHGRRALPRIHPPDHADTAVRLDADLRQSRG
jgi:hypothetical protein